VGGVCVVARLGIVVSTTTFGARLASIRILLATQSAWGLFRDSLVQQQGDSFLVQRLDGLRRIVASIGVHSIAGAEDMNPPHNPDIPLKSL